MCPNYRSNLVHKIKPLETLTSFSYHARTTSNKDPHRSVQIRFLFKTSWTKILIVWQHYSGIYIFSFFYTDTQIYGIQNAELFPCSKLVLAPFSLVVSFVSFLWGAMTIFKSINGGGKHGEGREVCCHYVFLYFFNFAFVLWWSSSLTYLIY